MEKYKVFENPLNGYRERISVYTPKNGVLWFFRNGYIKEGIALVVISLAAFFGSRALIHMYVSEYEELWQNLSLLTVPLIIVSGSSMISNLLEKRYLRSGWKFIGYEDEIKKKEQQQKAEQQPEAGQQQTEQQS